MKTYNSLLLASLLFIFSLTSTQADDSLYAGIAVGTSSYGYSNIDPGASSKLFFGYKVHDNLAIEATLYDSGDADPDNFPGVSMSSDGINLTAFYRQLTSVNNLTAMIGLGVYSFDTTLEGPGGSASESGSGLSLSAGLEIALIEHLALRADIDMFFGVKDFDQDNGLDSFNIGVVFNF